MSQIWNSADKASDIVLSGTYTNVVTKPSVTNTDSCVRATDVKTTGKYYWECTITNIAGNLVAVGISDETKSLTAFLGGTNASVGSYGDGNLLKGNVNIQTLPTWTTGDLVCFAVDWGAKLIWVRKGAAGNWNNNGANDPAAGSGGADFSSFWSGNGYPMFSIGNTTSGQATANFGDVAFTGAAPSGFSAYNAAAGGGSSVPVFMNQYRQRRA